MVELLTQLKATYPTIEATCEMDADTLSPVSSVTFSSSGHNDVVHRFDESNQTNLVMTFTPFGEPSDKTSPFIITWKHSFGITDGILFVCHLKLFKRRCECGCGAHTYTTTLQTPTGSAPVYSALIKAFDTNLI
jgi:hypothetical protein